MGLLVFVGDLVLYFFGGFLVVKIQIGQVFTWMILDVYRAESVPPDTEQNMNPGNEPLEEEITNMDIVFFLCWKF